MKNNVIPAISNEGNLSSYMEQIKKFPLFRGNKKYGIVSVFSIKQISEKH